MAIKHAREVADPASPEVGADDWNGDHIIDDDTLSIAKTNGLQAALDGKQPTLIKQPIAEFIPTNLVWTGITAPSGATLHQHSFVDCGGFVTGFVRLSWANTGIGLTRVTFDLPSEWPAPDFGDLPLVADGRYFTEWGRMVNSVTATSGSAGRTFLMRNSENTGWLIEVLTGSGSHSIAEANIRYWS